MENGIGTRIVVDKKKTRKPDYVQWLNDLTWMGKSWTNTAVLTVERTTMIPMEMLKLGSYAYKF